MLNINKRGLMTPIIIQSVIAKVHMSIDNDQWYDLA